MNIKKTLLYISIFVIGTATGFIANGLLLKNKITDLQVKNDKMYEIGTDMGIMGADFNQMYILCREENKALLDKDYENVARLFEEQTVLQTKIDALYSRYQNVPQEIIEQYKYNRVK